MIQPGELGITALCKGSSALQYALSQLLVLRAFQSENLVVNTFSVKQDKFLGIDSFTSHIHYLRAEAFGFFPALCILLKAYPHRTREMSPILQYLKCLPIRKLRI